MLHILFKQGLGAWLEAGVTHDVLLSLLHCFNRLSHGIVASSDD
jgi:hypothetical protein